MRAVTTPPAESDRDHHQEADGRDVLDDEQPHQEARRRGRACPWRGGTVRLLRCS